MKSSILLIFSIIWRVLYVLCAPAVDNYVYKENIELIPFTKNISQVDSNRSAQRIKSETDRKESQPHETTIEKDDYEKSVGLVPVITGNIKQLNSTNLVLGSNSEIYQKGWKLNTKKAMERDAYKENIELVPITKSIKQVDSIGLVQRRKSETDGKSFTSESQADGMAIKKDIYKKNMVSLPIITKSIKHAVLEKNAKNDQKEGEKAKDVYKEYIEMMPMTKSISQVDLTRLAQRRKSETDEKSYTSATESYGMAIDKESYKRNIALEPIIVKGIKKLYSTNIVLGSNVKTDGKGYTSGSQLARKAVEKDVYKENIELVPITRSIKQLESSADANELKQKYLQKTHTI